LLEKFVDLIAISAPLGWIHHNSIELANEWEKRATKLIEQTDEYLKERVKVENVNKEEKGVYGCSTTEEPYSYDTTPDKNVFAILFRKEFNGSVVGFKEHHIKELIRSFNQAYQFGFEDCGSKLMPELMKGPVAMHEIPVESFTTAVCDNCDGMGKV
jgi:hypothetical protein